VIDQFDPESCCKLFSPFADEVDMWTLAQDQARCSNRVTNALNAAHASGAHGATVHDERIHLDFAVRSKKTAQPRIEGVVIFHDNHCLFDRLEGRTSGI